MQDFNVEQLVMNSIDEVSKHDVYSIDQAIKVVEIAFNHRHTQAMQDIADILDKGLSRINCSISQENRDKVINNRKCHY